MATSTFQQLENRLDNLERKVFGQNDKEIDYPKVMFASKYKNYLAGAFTTLLRSVFLVRAHSNLTYVRGSVSTVGGYRLDTGTCLPLETSV